MVKLPPGIHSIARRWARASAVLGDDKCTGIGTSGRKHESWGQRLKGALRFAGVSLRRAGRPTGMRGRLTALRSIGCHLAASAKSSEAPMKILSTSAAIAVSLVMASARPSHAKPEPARPAVDPEAIAALQKMGAFLRDQQV